MNQVSTSSTASEREEFEKLLRVEMTKRQDLRRELLAAYRKQDAQLSRILVLEDLLAHRGVMSFVAGKVLKALPGGEVQSNVKSVKNMARSKSKAAINKSKAAVKKSQRLAGRVARKVGLR
ncbi:hypothetical protein HD598_000820 [Neomicrococcus aestuarii]|uniref:Uncharacterized protein n=1 Tax=Neomicrococcus aestuarii TaxID=556325 RepID=A0A7W8WZT1_9MICC|nr:hypothetical protein [Neomicrococcus aestuarii]MBB5512133.1 hypothetical protein [Neomicrococcus aestuarii]